MDAAARLGLGVIASPGSSAGSSFDAAKVRETVRRWDRHPALSGWYLIDEPDLNEVPAEQVALARDTVKSAGAQNPRRWWWPAAGTSPSSTRPTY